ncbi:NAD(P)-binding protein [Aulographum hederae CBS 113979]|uniref:NAD(P)-binding protein n=1 Tax=Aulographum hederae CBS 113979 TaxID=1176131 RepID=A0A6G1HB68_9PEZI|nr:NAD(P)-binding protein [Aulographum hederae CBS 113979]
MAPSQMKGILIEKFLKSHHELQICSVPPPLIGTNTLLIRITHTSPTHVDLLYLAGKHQNNRRHMRPPFILGTDFAGTVVSSPAFSPFKPGDNVFGVAQGAFAEYVSVDVGKGYGSVRRVPRGWTNAEACAVGVSGAVSYGALAAAAQLQKGETVLVLGAGGGLGVIACQIALAMGAHVIGVVGDKEKAAVLRRMGVEDVVGYNLPGWEDKVKALMAEKGKEGVDVVYDSVGKVESSLRCLRYGGRVVIVGFAARNGVMEKVGMNRILLKGAGVVGYRFGEHGRRHPEETEAIWDEFMKMAENGNIKAVVYEERYKGVQDIPRALEDLHVRKVIGRAVVTISEDSSAQTVNSSKL